MSATLAIMSTAAATFTVQDFAPDMAQVFETARRLGKASLRTVAGETFEVTIQPKPAPSTEAMLAKYEAHAEHLRQLGVVQPTPAENERINRIIAGEI